jgi:hypothetical protein
VNAVIVSTEAYEQASDMRARRMQNVSPNMYGVLLPESPQLGGQSDDEEKEIRNSQTEQVKVDSGVHVLVLYNHKAGTQVPDQTRDQDHDVDQSHGYDGGE